MQTHRRAVHLPELQGQVKRQGQGLLRKKRLRQKAWRHMAKDRGRIMHDVNWMCRLTDGLDTGDLLTILQWDLHRDRVKTYCPRSRTLESAATVPWPIRLLILRRHRKHIMMSKALPHVSSVREQVQDFQHRMRWKLYFQLFPQASCSFRAPKTSRAAPFNRQAQVGERHEWTTMEWWLREVSSRVLKAASAARSRTRFSTRSFSTSVHWRLWLFGFFGKVLLSRCRMTRTRASPLSTRMIYSIFPRLCCRQGATSRLAQSVFIRRAARAT